MVLVVGGSASGKSAWAEEAAARLGTHRSAGPLYLATMNPVGREAQERIARHRNMREGKGFRLAETTDVRSLAAVDAKGRTALLDDLGNLVANEMFADPDSPARTEDVRDRVVGTVASLSSSCADLVVVADLVGADGYRYDACTAGYIDAVASCCCALAQKADLVVEVSCGVATAVRGDLSRLAADARPAPQKG